MPSNPAASSTVNGRRVAVLCSCTMACLVVVSGPASAEPKLTFTPARPGLTAEPRTECDVQVLDVKPERTYVTLGFINYHNERHRSFAASLTLDAAMPAIKEAVCKAGGDAIFGVRVLSPKRLEQAMFNVSATVIRFDGPDPVPTPNPQLP